MPQVDFVDEELRWRPADVYLRRLGDLARKIRHYVENEADNLS
jgi:hypothetical protein